MLLDVRHETTYRYAEKVTRSTQYIRLTPFAGPRQRVIGWQVELPGPSVTMRDAFDNETHLLTLDSAHSTIQLIARGRVEVDELDHGEPAGRQGLCGVDLQHGQGMAMALDGDPEAVAGMAGRQGIGFAALQGAALVQRVSGQGGHVALFGGVVSGLEGVTPRTHLQPRLRGPAFRTPEAASQG